MAIRLPMNRRHPFDNIHIDIISNEMDDAGVKVPCIDSRAIPSGPFDQKKQPTFPCISHFYRLSNKQTRSSTHHVPIKEFASLRCVHHRRTIVWRCATLSRRWRRTCHHVSILSNGNWPGIPILLLLPDKRASQAHLQHGARTCRSCRQTGRTSRVVASIWGCVRATPKTFSYDLKWPVEGWIDMLCPAFDMDK